jgi:hypothetical protein
MPRKLAVMNGDMTQFISTHNGYLMFTDEPKPTSYIKGKHELKRFTQEQFASIQILKEYINEAEHELLFLQRKTIHPSKSALHIHQRFIVNAEKKLDRYKHEVEQLETLVFVVVELTVRKI